MKASDKKKLEKALALLQKAQELVNEVAQSDRDFCFSGNNPEARVSSVVSVIRTEIKNAE
jgi:hypothetical protein